MALRSQNVAQSGDTRVVAPFVRKLSCLLDNPMNKHVIRWSEEGDSFIVLDKTQFAELLLPEFFNHRNYASFVRQLNSYGFHKRVSLSDTSMRARERKSTALSEYSHPHFIRGHPNLLSLIKTKNEKKGQTSQEMAQHDAITRGNHPKKGDSDAGHEEVDVPINGPGHWPTSLSIQDKDTAFLRNSLHEIRKQQKLIIDTIHRLQMTNKDLKDRALVFQRLHDQHQKSIEAILQFIAILFPKYLNEHTDGRTGITYGQIASDFQQPPDHNRSVGTRAHIESRIDAMSLHSDVLDATAGPPLHGPCHGDSISSSSAVSSSQIVATPTELHYLRTTTVHDRDSSDQPKSTLRDTPRHEIEETLREHTMEMFTQDNTTGSLGGDIRMFTELAGTTQLGSDKDSWLESSACAALSHPVCKHTSHLLSPAMQPPPVLVTSLSEQDMNQAEYEQLQNMQQNQGTKIAQLGSILGSLSPWGYVPGLVDDTGTYVSPSLVHYQPGIRSDVPNNKIVGDKSSLLDLCQDHVNPVTKGVTDLQVSSVDTRAST